MTLRSSDYQSDSDLDSIRDSCDVFLWKCWKDVLKDLFTSADTVQDNEENINRKKVVRISIICNLEFVIDKLFVIFFFATIRIRQGCNQYISSKLRILSLTLDKAEYRKVFRWPLNPLLLPLRFILTAEKKMSRASYLKLYSPKVFNIPP